MNETEPNKESDGNIVVDGVEMNEEAIRALITAAGEKKDEIIRSPLMMSMEESERAALSTGVGIADAANVLGNAFTGKATAEQARGAVNFLTNLVFGYTNATRVSNAARREEMHGQTFTGIRTLPGEQIVQSDDRNRVMEHQNFIIGEQAKRINELTLLVEKAISKDDSTESQSETDESQGIPVSEYINSE